jgi:hypothetical protein
MEQIVKKSPSGIITITLDEEAAKNLLRNIADRDHKLTLDLLGAMLPDFPKSKDIVDDQIKDPNNTFETTKQEPKKENYDFGKVENRRICPSCNRYTLSKLKGMTDQQICPECHAVINVNGEKVGQYNHKLEEIDYYDRG